jgi:hypothetical protein
MFFSDPDNALGKFIQSLTLVPIWSVIDMFLDGIAIARTPVPAQNPSSLSLSVNTTLNTLHDKPISKEAANKIFHLWDAMEGLIRYATITKVDICIGQALTMFATWSPFMWLDGIVANAISLLDPSTADEDIHTDTFQNIDGTLDSDSHWVHKLINDVYKLHNQKGRGRKSAWHTFLSADYIPDIPHQSYDCKITGFSYDSKVTLRNVHTAFASILKSWLRFPTNELKVCQYAIVDALI